jgi:hypothetical protein
MDPLEKTVLREMLDYLGRRYGMYGVSVKDDSRVGFVQYRTLDIRTSTYVSYRMLLCENR